MIFVVDTLYIYIILPSSFSTLICYHDTKPDKVQNSSYEVHPQLFEQQEIDLHQQDPKREDRFIKIKIIY